MGCLIWYNGRLVGMVELLNMDKAANTAEIGFWIGEPYQHRGITRRAASSLITHAFGYLEFAEIHARTNPRNDSSRGLLESLGFAAVADGRAIHYMMTKGDWPKQSN